MTHISCAWYFTYVQDVLFHSTESALYNVVKLNAKTECKMEHLCADSTDITIELQHKIAQLNCEEKYY